MIREFERCPTISILGYTFFFFSKKIEFQIFFYNLTFFNIYRIWNEHNIELEIWSHINAAIVYRIIQLGKFRLAISMWYFHGMKYKLPYQEYLYLVIWLGQYHMKSLNLKPCHTTRSKPRTDAIDASIHGSASSLSRAPLL